MSRVVCIAVVLGICSGGWGPVNAIELKDLPQADQALANTVDPWGLAFSDQLRRFSARFEANPDAPFAVGLTHGLVKIWPNKYWYRGPSALPNAPSPDPVQDLIVAAGETLSLQVVILPALGAPERQYTVTASATGGATAQLWRQVWVKTAEPMYPRYNVERWPDPLVPENTVTVGGTEVGAFWVDLRVPAQCEQVSVGCAITVASGADTATWELDIRVVPGLKLEPKRWPLIAWFWPTYPGGTLSDGQMLAMYDLLLEHHFQPIDALRGKWNPERPEAFDELHARLAERGQTLFELDSPTSESFPGLYEHVKAAGWLDRCVAYSNQDEPTDAEFLARNIPFMTMVREKYPGLRVYVASDWHEGMERGCDIWMTDISASGYDPERHSGLTAPELWHYYCHLPIKWQMRAPLVRAPNMQIDNDALEHRLALWMSRHYGAKAVFIWAGNSWTFAEDFWQTLALSDEKPGFPYGGIHNGNGWVVYPPREPGGPVLPSVRLKALRDGMQDIALMDAARGLLDTGRLVPEKAEQLRTLLNPRPEVFMRPQYFDHQPETLLSRRQAILELLGG